MTPPPSKSADGPRICEECGGEIRSKGGVAYCAEPGSPPSSINEAGWRGWINPELAYAQVGERTMQVMPVGEHERLREAAQAVAITTCCEWVDEKADRCNAAAEFVLWGKLFDPEAMGPRCYDHAAKWAGHQALGDPAWAIIDLRPLRAALAPADPTRVGKTDDMPTETALDLGERTS